MATTAVSLIIRSTLTVVGILLCVVDCASSTAPVRQPGKCMIWVDYSASDSSRWAQMLDHVVQVCTDLPYSSEWKVCIYPLHGMVGRGTRPLDELKLERCRYRQQASVVEKYREDRDRQLSESVGVLLQCREAVDRGTSGKTCILDAMFYVREFFRGDAPETPRMLVFISDMIEDCPDSGINLCSFSGAWEDAAAQAIEYVSPGVFLQAVKIDIYLHVDPSPSCRSLKDQTLYQFWMRVLQSLGASVDQVSFH